ncbi:hypothetical protein [Paenibacillus hexagrammi]|uniref:Uncharacterized protein n=1 Tax=Paenibacillus hexagrammi TaxID=2908839 RepID=A0ABY3SP98_9BACL|nr:hypothetical protein [Paenibacillus sp. YPD9-1]UJF35524.1 hypothetical protein L0M14_10725 [Paenibacillus sp. YPD9-1]
MQLKEAPWDPRAFHVLWNHKNIMLLRLSYLAENDYIAPSNDLKNKYVEIEKQSLVSRNLFLRYFIEGRNDSIIRIMEKLRFIEQEERETLEKLLQRFPKF